MRWAAVLLVLAGCVETGNLPPTRVSGKEIYLEKCAMCHGDDAQGAGAFGMKLLTIPPELTTLSARNGGVFPRDYVMSTIDGFERRPHFSGAMPRFGEGDLGPLVVTDEGGVPVPVPEELLLLADYLETLQE